MYLLSLKPLETKTVAVGESGLLMVFDNNEDVAESSYGV